MLNWNIFKDRLWLWLAGLSAAALMLSVIMLLDSPILQYLPLIALLWLPILVHLLAKTDTPADAGWTYCCYLVLILRVAGPSLPSGGILGWVKSLGPEFSTLALFAVIGLTALWIWQIRRGNGVKTPPKNNEKQLNIGEKYA